MAMTTWAAAGRRRGSGGPEIWTLQALTCGTCYNHVDPATLSGGGGSRGHPDPLNFCTP